MSENLPLKALQAFDAAMRLNSFSLAAEQLSVTPGAVSQQIRKLEDWLGLTLFTRQVRQVQPTADALAYWAQVQPALQQIQQASRSLRARRSHSVVLSMPPSLAAKWFARRMADFMGRYPQINLNLSSSSLMVDFQRDGVDLSIRYFDGEDDGLDVTLLHQGEARAFCAPHYRFRDDLTRATLLHDTWHAQWNEWLALHGAAAVTHFAGVQFDQSLMAIEAARHGQGLVLAASQLVEEELADGSLIEPYATRLVLPRSFYVVHPRQATLRPAVALLKQWLIEQGTSPG